MKRQFVWSEWMSMAAIVISVSTILLNISIWQERRHQFWVARMISCQEIEDHQTWVKLECPKAFREAME